MTTVRVVGQRPKMHSSDGRFLRFAYNGEIVGLPQPSTDDLYGDDPVTRYCTVSSGGGFDSSEEVHAFRIPGTVIRIIHRGDATSYSVTEIDVPDPIARIREIEAAVAAIS